LSRKWKVSQHLGWGGPAEVTGRGPKLGGLCLKSVKSTATHERDPSKKGRKGRISEENFSKKSKAIARRYSRISSGLGCHGVKGD